MKPRKSYGRFMTVVVMAALLLVTALAPGALAQRGRPTRPPTTPPPPPTQPPPPSYNAADREFVEMMIPHHYQALLMSQMAPARSNNAELRALASRIDVEQGLEISMMQGWQSTNGLPVTNAQMAYEHMLQMPEMLEAMGMATPAEMSALSASSGAAFDRLYLELMIEHHNGAVDMLVHVLSHGQDTNLQFWATDMLTAQSIQIWQMEQMLAEMT